MNEYKIIGFIFAVFLLLFFFGRVAAQSKKKKNKYHLSNLKGFPEKEIVKSNIGDTIIYEGIVSPHFSTLDYSIENESIVKYLYNTSKRSAREDEDGGHIILQFYFQAIAKGNTTIEIEEKINKKLHSKGVFSIYVQ